MSFGHYTAFLKHPVSQRWYMCNGMFRTEVSLYGVLSVDKKDLIAIFVFLAVYCMSLSAKAYLKHPVWSFFFSVNKNIGRFFLLFLAVHGLSLGHYTVCLKHPVSQRWYMCNGMLRTQTILYVSLGVDKNWLLPLWGF